MKRKKKRSESTYDSAFMGEVKKILMGRYQLVDGIIIALEERNLTNFLSYSGTVTGGGKVGVFGVKSMSVTFASSDPSAEIYNDFIRVLLRYGKTAAFVSDPDALGFINRNSLTNPVLYVLYETIGGVRLDLYTAKAASASVVLLRAVRNLEEDLPEGVYKLGIGEPGISDDDE